MKYIKTTFLAILSVAVAMVLTVVGLQTWYHFTPVALSQDVVTLNERAATRPEVTENGYRSYGLLAPQGQDPVAYGRCLMDTFNKQKQEDAASGVRSPDPKDKAAYDAFWNAKSDRDIARRNPCLNGGKQVSVPRDVSESKVHVPISREVLTQLSAIPVDPVLIDRAEQVWAGGPRRLGVEVDSPLPNYGPLTAIGRWRIARGAAAWDAGDRAGGAAIWAQSIRDWTKTADSTLIEAMVASSAVSQTLIVMQQSAAQAQSLDDATVSALLSALQPVATLPQAVADSMLSEWQMHRSIVEWAKINGASTMMLDEPSLLSGMMASFGRFTLDSNDSLNRSARINLWSQSSVLAAARGAPAPVMPQEFVDVGCPTQGTVGLLCALAERNPGGRIMTAIAAPMYTDYGVRVSEVMNLANATRLTISARQQGLVGDALARWIAATPREMRDVHTGQAFRYDAAERKLTVDLTSKSPGYVLGDKGAYSLRL